MPSWKKVLISGSDAALNTLIVTNGITGSLFGTASYATSASQALTASYSKNLQISGSINNVDYIDFNTGSAIPAYKSGRVYWDNTEGALSVYNAEADIALQIGQESWVRVFNETGVTITNGTAVRIVGSHGDVPLIIKAQSVQVSGSALGDNQIIGIATHDIETNSIGYVTTQGLTRGLNTNTFTDGDLLFVSSSAGLLTNVIPQAPYEVIQVGICVKAGPGGSGIIFVFPTQPIDFGDLASAERGVYQYGDIWSYQQTGSVGVWRHGRSLSGSYSITGSLNVSAGITGSLFGTASYATSASHALTASYVNTIAPNITNNTNNFILTATGNGNINGESNLQFDGSNDTLTLSGKLSNGTGTLATGDYSHAEGDSTTASGSYSHTEGFSTQALGVGSHAEGDSTIASGSYSHAEGNNTIASGSWSHSEGSTTIALGDYSHAEGSITIASGDYSHAEGEYTSATFAGAHAEGVGSIAAGYASHAEGDHTSATLDGAHSEGSYTLASGYNAHSEGTHTLASAYGSHAEGYYTTASGDHSHAEGYYTIASGMYSHAEGNQTTSSEQFSHAEGYITLASGYGSHAEGDQTQATVQGAHAEGRFTVAQGLYSHAEGHFTSASGGWSHAEGSSSIASGTGSHAEGLGTVALGNYQHVQGQYNISSSAQSAFIVGNGASTSSRSNLIFASGTQVQITGSLIATQGITGSFLGTASYATSASQAISASFAINASSSLFAISSSFSSRSFFTYLETAANNTNYKIPFSNATDSTNGFYRLLQESETTFTYNPSTNTLTAGTFSGSLTGTSSYATSASRAISASYATIASSSLFATNASSSLWAVSSSQANSASFAINASSSLWAVSSSRAVSASYATVASSSLFSISASFLNSTTNAFIQGGNSFGATALLGTNDNQSLALETSGSTRMFISSSGNVGIGTTNPEYTLDVYSPSSRFGQGNHGYVIISDDWSGGELGVMTDTQEIIAVKYQDGTFRYGGQDALGNPSIVVSGSNLGIGTTNPNAKLDVSGSAIITGSLQISSSIFQYSNNAAITSGSTANIASFPTSSYMAGFFDFVASSGLNARAGTVFTVWNGASLEYVETSTNDIGSTSNLVLSASISGTNVLLQGTSLSGSWNVKTLTRMI